MDLQHIRSLLQHSFKECLSVHLPYTLALHPEKLEREREIMGEYALAIALTKEMTQEDIDRACVDSTNGMRLQEFVICAYEMKVAREKPGLIA